MNLKRRKILNWETLKWDSIVYAVSSLGCVVYDEQWTDDVRRMPNMSYVNFTYYCRICLGVLGKTSVPKWGKLVFGPSSELDFPNMKQEYYSFTVWHNPFPNCSTSLHSGPQNFVLKCFKCPWIGDWCNNYTQHYAKYLFYVTYLLLRGTSIKSSCFAVWQWTLIWLPD